MSGSTAAAPPALNSFDINPGLSASFPWLGNVARNFEQYRFNKLKYHFVSHSATAIGSTNTALGDVLLVTQFDPLDAAFATTAEIQNYEGSSWGRPSKNITHTVDVRRSKAAIKNLFVRAAAAPADTDIRMYDVGRFSLGTAGMQAASVLGDLVVEYDVTLIRAKTYVAPAADLYHSYGEVPINEEQVGPGTPPFADDDVHYLMGFGEQTIVQNSFDFDLKIDQNGSRLTFARRPGKPKPQPLDIFMWVRVFRHTDPMAPTHRSFVGPNLSYFASGVHTEAMLVHESDSNTTYGSGFVEYSSLNPIGTSRVIGLPDGIPSKNTANTWMGPLHIEWEEEVDSLFTDPLIAMVNYKDFGLQNLPALPMDVRYEICMFRMIYPINPNVTQLQIDPRRAAFDEKYCTEGKSGDPCGQTPCPSPSEQALYQEFRRKRDSVVLAVPNK
jgi:hypothetical protein